MSGIRDQVPVSHQELLEIPLTAVLTTVDSSSRPQSTAVWYFVDDDGQLKGSITSDRRKYKNLLANPNCSLLIIDPQNTYRTLEIRAVAQLHQDVDKTTLRKVTDIYRVEKKMTERMLNAAEDRYTVTYRPRRIVVNPPAALGNR